MGHELAYISGAQGGNKHLSPVQKWDVKVANGVAIKLMLGGMRQNGERNTFAMKHLMAPSKKANQTQEQKAEKRLAHRVDHVGNKAENPLKGAKAASPYAQVRKDKYGTAATLNANNTTAANTAIDLSLINLNTALYKLAEACEKAGLDFSQPGHVTIDFGVACVRKVQANWVGAGQAFTFTHSPLARTVQVTGLKVGESSYEVYHLG